MAEQLTPYPIIGPIMDRSMPPNQLRAGRFGYLAGVDGRFNGCLRNFYGMDLVGDISLYSGVGGDGPVKGNVSFFRHVVFQKGTTSAEFRGFVIRHSTEEGIDTQDVDLFYYESGAWSSKAIFDNSDSITSTTRMDCTTNGKFLLVVVEGVGAKSIYYTSSLQVKAMGAGNFALESGIDIFTSTTISTSELVANGNFAVDGGWTEGAGWDWNETTQSIKWTESDGTENLQQTVTLSEGDSYRVQYTLSNVTFAGNNAVVINLGGTAGTSRTTAGTYTETIAAGASNYVRFTPTAAGNGANGVCYIDNISVVHLDSDYHLAGDGTYRIAFRFYDSTRGIYSALCPSTTVKLSEGTADFKYLITAAFPNSATGFLYSDSGDGFGEIFDKVEVFRTLNLGVYDAFEGAIYYKESTVDIPGTSGAWDSLTVAIGSLRDESLVVQDRFDPITDIMIAVPSVGAIGTWEALTFMSRITTTRNGIDTIFSDPRTLSPEYFTDQYLYRAQMGDGRPLRYLVAGDTFFILHSQCIVYVEKREKTLYFSRQHVGRGLTSAGAAHTIGNDLIILTPLGIATVDGKTTTMRIFTSLDRMIFDDWQGDLDSIESCYDSYMNTSFFLNTNDDEICCIWWSNKAVSMLEGANFVGCSSGVDVLGTSHTTETHAYFITVDGRIVSPDLNQDSGGTMFAISTDYTLNGTITSGTGTTELVDTSATFDTANTNSMGGALIYMTSGDNAGECVEISSVDDANTLTLAAGLSNNLAPADRYAISPVPFKARFWNIPEPQQQREGMVKLRTKRRVMTSVGIKVQRLGGFTGNDNDKFRIGAYRNGSSTLESGDGATDYLTASENPAEMVAALRVDGVDLEPYVEMISAGAKFELTNLEVGGTITVSQKIAD